MSLASVVNDVKIYLTEVQQKCWKSVTVKTEYTQTDL